MAEYNFEHLPLFQGISGEQLEQLRLLFVPGDYYAGTVLFEQGDPALYFYLVLIGEVAIRYKPEDGQPILITRIRTGGVVGWSAVIGRRRYTSAAVCTEDARLLRIRGSDLQAFCEREPEIGRLLVDRLAQVVAQRSEITYPQIMALLENGIRNGVHKEAK